MRNGRTEARQVISHVEESGKGTRKSRRESNNETDLGNTRFVTNHYQEFQSSGWPSVRSIDVADILNPVYVI